MGKWKNGSCDRSKGFTKALSEFILVQQSDAKSPRVHVWRWPVKRLLIVDNDPGLRRTMTISFGARGFEVDVAPDGRTALESLSRQPAVIIMDLDLPDMDGVELIVLVRARTSAPIIVISARRAEHHKVDALDAGADDFVTKPFGMDELVARARAALRRPELAALPVPAVTADAFTLNFLAKRATRDGATVTLTPIEWHLAEALVRNQGSMVPSADLLTEIWGPHSAKECHLLRIHIGHLRHKLEDHPSSPVHFVTVKGLGYRFESAPTPGP